MAWCGGVEATATPTVEKTMFRADFLAMPDPHTMPAILDPHNGQICQIARAATKAKSHGASTGQTAKPRNHFYAFCHRQLLTSSGFPASTSHLRATPRTRQLLRGHLRANLGFSWGATSGVWTRRHGEDETAKTETEAAPDVALSRRQDCGHGTTCHFGAKSTEPRSHFCLSSGTWKPTRQKRRAKNDERRW